MIIILLIIASIIIITVFIDWYITLECMSKEDYEALEEIAGREVCGDELCELYPIFSDTEDLKERFNDEFD